MHTELVAAAPAFFVAPAFRRQSRLLAAAVSLSSVLGLACGSSPGGLGIGFGSGTAPGDEATAALRIERVYVPVTSGGAAYVELSNGGPDVLDWTVAPAKLIGAFGEAELPSAGTFEPGARLVLTGSAIEPLHLEPDTGELLLTQGDLAPMAYVSWGQAPATLASGLANIARRSAVPVVCAYPLPVPRSDGQALLFGQEPNAVEWCADANAGIAEPARMSCRQGP